MAKGPIMTDRVKQLIAQVYLEHPDWRAKEIQYEVNRKLGSNFPGLSAVQKQLTEIRKNNEVRSPESKALDGPWGTFTMAKYPIPPEALPSVLQIWVWSRENIPTPFTIRQAQWVARLYAVTKDIAILALLSGGHAFWEKIYEITGIPMGVSANIDLMVFSVMTGQVITPERRKQILGLSEEQWLAFKKTEEFVDTHEYSEIKDMILEALKKGGTK